MISLSTRLPEGVICIDTATYCTICSDDPLVDDWWRPKSPCIEANPIPLLPPKGKRQKTPLV